MFSKIALTGILALAMATPAFNSAAAHTAYDGSWALTIMTKRGACDPTYNFQVQIANGIVSHPNLVKLRGRVSSGGGKLGFDANGRKVVGMVAEFSDYKDFSTFIQAAQEVLARRRDVVFVAVGDGKNLNACRRMVSTDEKSILFLGERKDVETLVQRMDIGVLCTFTEGISNSVMEYMAAGRPVVVTNGGGSCELITDGVQGFLVPPAQPLAVAEKIELLAGDSVKARQMGLAGRKRIEQRFSIKQMTDATIRMYRETLAGTASKS